MGLSNLFRKKSAKVIVQEGGDLEGDFSGLHKVLTGACLR